MDTMLIQITNQKAAKLLHDLEDLNLIKVLKKSLPMGQKPSERFAGKLSPETAEALREHATKVRSEWGRNI